MNVTREIMRREERMLVPWLIDESLEGADLANKQRLLYSPGGEVIIGTSDAVLLFHDSSV